jgi:alkylation response protein AidB-like acyl-CoA dehydrogenase
MRIEQTELRDGARDILAGLAGAAVSDAWNIVVEAGWTAITAPEVAGGLEQPLEAACWLHQEQGFALSPIPLLSALLAADALSAAGSDRVAALVAGKPVAVSLLDPDQSGLVLADGRLSGTFKAVEGAVDGGDLLLVLPGLLAQLPLSTPGMTVTPHRLWDETRRLAEITVDGLALSPAAIIAEGVAADRATAALRTHLHFAIAADCVGGAEALLAQTVDYLKTRRQFDRPLAMFQALKHRCADLRMLVSMAQALQGEQLRALETGSGDPVTLALGAKSLCSVTFRAVAEAAVQLHGGIGMTAEHSCHRYVKRALLNEQLGTPDDLCDLAVANAFIATLAA